MLEVDKNQNPLEPMLRSEEEQNSEILHPALFPLFLKVFQEIGSLSQEQVSQVAKAMEKITDYSLGDPIRKIRAILHRLGQKMRAEGKDGKIAQIVGSSLGALVILTACTPDLEQRPYPTDTPDTDSAPTAPAPEPVAPEGEEETRAAQLVREAQERVEASANSPIRFYQELPMLSLEGEVFTEIGRTSPGEVYTAIGQRLVVEDQSGVKVYILVNDPATGEQAYVGEVTQNNSTYQGIKNSKLPIIEGEPRAVGGPEVSQESGREVATQEIIEKVSAELGLGEVVHTSELRSSGLEVTFSTTSSMVDELKNKGVYTGENPFVIRESKKELVAQALKETLLNAYARQNGISAENVDLQTLVDSGETVQLKVRVLSSEIEYRIVEVKLADLTKANFIMGKLGEGKGTAQMFLNADALSQTTLTYEEDNLGNSQVSFVIFVSDIYQLPDGYPEIFQNAYKENNFAESGLSADELLKLNFSAMIAQKVIPAWLNSLSYIGLSPELQDGTINSVSTEELGNFTKGIDSKSVLEELEKLGLAGGVLEGLTPLQRIEFLKELSVLSFSNQQN